MCLLPPILNFNMFMKKETDVKNITLEKNEKSKQ